MSCGRHHNVRYVLWALCWIALGTLLWLSSRGIITWRFTWAHDWPVILIIIGAVMLAKFIARQFRRAPAAFPASTATVETTATDTSRPARWLKIIVCENNATTPSVRVTLPLAVLRMATKLGGSLNLNIPESARAKMKEKGVELDPKTFEHLDELFDQLAVNGRLELVNIVDEDDGDRVQIFVE